MSDQDNSNSGPDAESAESAVEDLGTPVAQLLGHTVPVPQNFKARVGRSIERRVLAADATQFSLLAPLATLMEFLRAVFEGLGLIDAAPEREASSTEDATE